MFDWEPTRTLRRRRCVLARTLWLAAGIVATTAAPGVVDAHTEMPPALAGTPPPPANYVTTTTSNLASLDVSAFSPECVRDAPIINYTIVPAGFTPVDGSATLAFRTADGTLVDTRQVSTLSGQLVWPGAQVDSSGNAVDWPGWKRAPDGVSWIPDPSDSAVRDGLSIEVTVNSATQAVTATATVAYPPASSPCAGPPRINSLPPTGGGGGNTVILGAAVFLGGLLLVTAARRRRRTALPAA